MACHVTGLGKHHSDAELAYSSISYMTHFGTWAAQYSTWLLIKLTPKGVGFSFLLLTLAGLQLCLCFECCLDISIAINSVKHREQCITLVCSPQLSVSAFLAGVQALQ